MSTSYSTAKSQAAASGSGAYSRIPGQNTRQAANMMVGGAAGGAKKPLENKMAGKPPANSLRNGPNVRAVMENGGKRGNSRGVNQRMASVEEDKVMSGGNQYNSRGAAAQRSDSANRRQAAAAYGRLNDKQN